MNTILKAENIFKSFVKSKEQKLEILKGISLELEANKITEIVGASGAGKSTLLHILSGLDTPDSGKVEIEGTEIFKLSDEKLSKFRNKNIRTCIKF